MARVAVRRSPFTLERVTGEVPAGVTVAEAVEAWIADLAWREHAVVSLGGDPVPRSEWASARLREGDHLTIVVQPGGAAVVPLLQIGLAAVSTYAGAYAATAAGFALTTTAGAALAAGVGAGVYALGALALQSLVPPPSLSSSAFRGSQHWAVEGVGNRLTPYAPVPRVLGRVRMYPPLAGQPRWHVREGSQDVSVLLCWGYGPLQVSSIMVGETDIASLGAQHEFFPGDPAAGVPAFSLYRDLADTQLVDVDLPHVNPQSDWVQRTSDAGAEALQVVLLFPQGLLRVGRNTGDRIDGIVKIEVETSPAGLGTWTNHGVFEFRARTTSPFRRVIELQASGATDIRLRRLWHSGDSRWVADSCTWEKLISLRSGQPVLTAGMAYSAVRFQSSDRVRGQLEQVNGIVESVAPDWDAGAQAWVERVTRNPASLARLVLQGGGNRRPLSDAELDLPAFQDWHEYCESNGLACDLLVDWKASVEEVLRIVAAAGHAVVVPLPGTGRWTPVVDRAQSVPVQLFTPRNMADFRVTRSLVEPPHALRVQYVDGATWQRDEVVVYADGYDAATATRFEPYEVAGVTDRAQAWREGRRRLAELGYRRETYEFEADFEHLAAWLGDRIEIQHHALGGLTGCARIAAVQTDGGGDVTAVDVDADIIRDAAVTYGVTVRRAAGLETWQLSPDTSPRTLTLASPIPAAQAPQVGDLVAVGPLSTVTVPAVVTAIGRGQGLTARVRALRYAAEVYATAAETPPPEATTPTPAPTYAPPSIAAVSASPPDPAAPETLQASVLLSHTAPPPDVVAVVVAWRLQGDEGPWTEVSAPPSAQTVTVTGLTLGLTYELRARYESAILDAWSSTYLLDTSTDTTTPALLDPVTGGGGLDATADLSAQIAAAIARGQTRIALESAPGTRVFVRDMVRIEQPDPSRHVTVDLSGLSIDAGKAFRISVRGELLELPEQDTFLLDQDAPAGSTAIRVNTNPQGGDHSLLQAGYEIVVRGQNDAAGNMLPGQKYEGVITSKTVIDASTVELGIDPALPEDFLVSYPDSEWVEEGGGVDQTHVSVRIPLRLTADAADGDMQVTVQDDPSLVALAPGDAAVLVDDLLDGDIQGTQDDPIRREPAVVEAVSGTGPWTVALRQRVRRDYAVSRNARLLKAVPAWHVTFVPPRDVVYVEAPDPAPASRVPMIELRYAVGCHVPDVFLDDAANAQGHAPRGPALRMEHCLGCTADGVSRIGKTDPSDATSGDRYGCYLLYCRDCYVRVRRMERCRHGIVYWCSTDCTSEGGIFRDCLINGLDTHGGWSTGCFHRGGIFSGGPTRAPDSTKQVAATFGNTSHLAGDYRCGVLDIVAQGFDGDGAVEVLTPCSDITATGTAIGCARALLLRQAGSLNGGSVHVPLFRQLLTPPGGRFLSDLSGSPKFQSVLLGEVWSDSSETKYWPSGSSGVAPVARQNFALHAQKYTGVSGSFNIPYTRGQWVEVELSGDVTSTNVTTEHLARSDDMLFLYVLVRQDGSGGHVWAHPANTSWPGGSPPGNTLLAGKATLFEYVSTDKGGSWIGLLVADGL